MRSGGWGLSIPILAVADLDSDFVYSPNSGFVFTQKCVSYCDSMRRKADSLIG